MAWRRGRSSRAHTGGLCRHGAPMPRAIFAGYARFRPAPDYIDAMTEGLPLSHIYNLARLGNAGDEVRFAADAAQCAGIAKWSGVLSVEKFETRVEIKK